MSEESTRWRVKNAVVEAVQWTGENIADVQALTSPSDFYAIDAKDADDPDATGALRETAHSAWTEVLNGTWIVKGITGLLFAVDDEKFREGYEPEDAPPPVDRDALARLAAKWHAEADDAQPDAADMASAVARRAAVRQKRICRRQLLQAIGLAPEPPAAAGLATEGGIRDIISGDGAE